MNSRSRPGIRYQALLQLLRTADTLWNASRLFFAQWNLSPSQFNILNLLAEERPGLSQIELGRLLITHRSNVTGLVDRLEKRRLVRRCESAGDRRAYRVILTGPGYKLVGEILPEFRRLAGRVWGKAPAGRVRELSGQLAHLSQNAQSIALSSRHP